MNPIPQERPDAIGPGNHLYIDLAQLGRTGFWVAVRGVGRILLYFLIGMVLAVGICVAYPPFLARLQTLQSGKAGLGFEFGAIVLQTAIIIWSVRDATVRTQRRPFGSLISATGRIDPRRFFGGILAWAIAAAIVTVVSLVIGIAFSRGTIPALPSFQLPGPNWLIAMALGVLVIPFQAGAEELLFRGWLTQTIGQWARNRIILALIVAFLFAAAHLGPGGPLALPYFMISSLGLSAISLTDQRLELAIGAHTAQNLFVLLVSTPLLEGAQPTLFGSTHEAIGAMALVGITVQNTLMVAICRAEWFRRTFRSGDVRTSELVIP